VFQETFPTKPGAAQTRCGRPASPFGFTSRARTVAGIVFLVGLVGVIDYASGFHLSFSIFYLLPIVWAGWRISGGFSALVAVLSVLVLNVGDWLAGERMGWAPIWNALIQLALYLIVVWLLIRWKKLREALEAKVEDRTQDLIAEIAARRKLEGELLNISEREQRRIGYDLHDVLCQHLAATALAGKVLEEKMSSGSAVAGHEIARVIRMVEKGMTIARDMARGLSPIPTGSGNVTSALEELAGRTSEHFRVDCRMKSDDPELAFDPSRASHLYRIAQEAVSNAIRHGKAKTITLTLSVIGERGLLSIQDDGLGMQLERPEQAGGLGLLIMKARAEILSGHLDIHMESGEGITVICSFPINEEIDAVDDTR